MSGSGGWKRHGALGKALMLLALVGLAVLVASRFTAFDTLLATLERGKWLWIAAGIGAHVLYFICYSVLYRLGFSIVGVKSSAMRLLPVVFAGIFLNSVVPTGGAGAAALFIDDAVQRGQSGARAAVGVVLVLLLDLVSLVVFIAYGIWFLSSERIVATYDWVGIALFVAYMMVLMCMLALARWRRRSLQRLLDGVRTLVHRVGRRLHKPDLLDAQWPERIAYDFNRAACAIDERPGRTALAVGWAFFTRVVNLVGLWLLLEAFNFNLPLGGLVAAFGMGIIFFIVAVIPEGVAVVETVMTLIFTALGISKTAAITATLVFRGVNFWLPLLIGIFALWRIRKFGTRRASG